MRSTVPSPTRRIGPVSRRHRDGLALADPVGACSWWSPLKYVLLLCAPTTTAKAAPLALVALARSGRWGARSLPLLASASSAPRLFFGDGMLTPAVTVLSAVEGLKVAARRARITCVPLAMSSWSSCSRCRAAAPRASASVFGPVMVVWFLVAGGMGLVHSCDDPTILTAINPWYAIQFMLSHGTMGWCDGRGGAGRDRLRGALCRHRPFRTQADPVRLVRIIVLPALLLNYFGQGALAVRTGGDRILLPAHPRTGRSCRWWCWRPRPPSSPARQ